MSVQEIAILSPALEAALLDELQRIVHKPLSTAMLRELEAMTRAVADVVRAKTSPGSRLVRASIDGGYLAGANTDVEGSLGDGPIQPFGGPAETFGASALRELVGTLKQDKKPPREDVGYETQQLLRAIKEAKEDQDLMVADALQQRLDAMLGIEGRDEEGSDAERIVQELTPPDGFNRPVSNAISPDVSRVLAQAAASQPIVLTDGVTP